MMAGLRKHNNNKRRKEFWKAGRPITFRMGRCPAVIPWQHDEYLAAFGRPFRGYKTYRRAHK